MEKSLIFLHIPKTAGTTLRTVIERIYSSEEVCHIYPDRDYSLDEFKKLGDEKKRGYRVFCGHMPFGVHEVIPGPATYITVLRDPIERVLSLYSHMSQDPAVPEYKPIKSGNMDAGAFVESGITIQADNHQTRLLSGTFPPYGECTPEMLERAQKNLREHFTVAGTTERFDESIVLMRRLFGWRTPFYVKKNVAKKRLSRGDLPKVALGTIMKYNELDIELFKYADRLLAEKLLEQGPDFNVELEEFRMTNTFSPVWFEDVELTEEISRKLTREMKKFKKSLGLRLAAPLRWGVRLMRKR